MSRLIILLLLFSCGQQADKLDSATMTDNKDSDLYGLLDQLPLLKTPLTFSSNNQTIKLSLGVKRNELTSKISRIITDFNVLGKVYQTEEFIAIVSVIREDNSTPVLTTYDKTGKEIDSFFMYPPNQDYYSTNNITLNESKEISSIDSVLTRQKNKKRIGKISSADSLNVTKKIFRINDKGEIERIR
ncbi:MAG: hypothetical protein RH948_12545 [Cyclobacteriaceae bacterium]